MFFKANSAAQRAQKNIKEYIVMPDYYHFLKIYSPPRSRVFNTLLIQYYSVICRPSDHTVGRRSGVLCVLSLIYILCLAVSMTPRSKKF